VNKGKKKDRSFYAPALRARSLRLPWRRQSSSTLFYVTVILHSSGSFDHHCNCTTLIVVGIAPAVVGIAPAVVVIATAALELAPYGFLGRLPVGDLNVEAPRVFKELQT